ncbi:leucine-rich repeat-containing protein 47 isoform X2 [Boleophthalmus pectinirostris]|uniref:leucine-rich repeat-containing protein 47 isoform X2 n=1 Tax=Boleophthalmus pectinirostris TaxID=150288 RepID=UPI000A1C2CB7|nr:leucine-rich repeat-containing protein 47 isoform X2 [Boleophthalmus pectinirostris]
MASGGGDGHEWPEIEKAASEKRRELVLQGPAVDRRVSAAGGLSSAVYSLTLLNYLEVSQCPSLTQLHEDIRLLINLQSLVLCRNKLVSVPRVDTLQALKVLDLSVNELGSLPEGVCGLKELTTLNLSCNHLETLPEGLSQCPKLSTLNVSKNRLSSLPSDLCSDKLELLSTVLASDNLLQELSPEVHRLPALKTLDLSNNKLSEIPPALSDCPKLKEINFKGNKLRDRRLEKMVNGCQTKSVLEYLRGKARAVPEGGSNGPRNAEKTKKGPQSKKKGRAPEPEEVDDVEDVAQMLVRVLHVSSAPPGLTVTVSPEVRDVRPYLVCCLVRGLNLRPGNALKRFLMAQNKLHEDVCGKRTTATIATHDVRLLKGPLTYGVKPPTQLKITALGRKEMSAVELIRHLHLEAEELRKQKKRQNVTGLHKYLQLLDGKPLYPCLMDAEGRVVSFPPITNSEHTKISKTTSELFVEVTSATSLQTCKDVMDALILKMCELNRFTSEHAEEAGSDGEGHTPSDSSTTELIVQQVRTVDPDGSLKVVYPSKTDLTNCPGVTVLW